MGIYCYDKKYYENKRKGIDMGSNSSNKDYKDYYEIIEGINGGGNGTVYKGRDKRKNELRAIKIMNLDTIRENLINEIDEKDDIENKLKSYINGFIN